MSIYVPLLFGQVFDVQSLNDGDKNNNKNASKLYVALFLRWVGDEFENQQKKNEKSKLKMCWICDKTSYHMATGS